MDFEIKDESNERAPRIFRQNGMAQIKARKES